MKYIKIYLFALIILCIAVSESWANPPQGRVFGLGLMIGEPTGLTAKLWTSNDNAFAFSLGNSYFGNVRFGIDYIWQLNAFNSRIVDLYAGLGAAIGLGSNIGWWYTNKNRTWYREDNSIGMGVRGLIGLNFIPRNLPLEFFGELGLMLGLVPGTFTNFEGAIGFRYYF